jgi:ribose 1,5-bisphosphokinase
MAGALVYVMGPSGAGKDSVLRRARAMLSVDLPIVFAHRYITRPVEAGGENHVALSGAEFALRRAHGLFAFHWHAHGNDYGIGHEIHAWRRAGLAVVVSGSREHFLTIDGVDEATVPVLITAPAERLEERLLKRGREDATAAAERLRRGVARDLDVAGAVTITNDGALDEAAKAFVRLLATLRHSPDVRRRA